MSENLETCHACGKPATGWKDGPGKSAVGACSDPACHELIAQRARGQESS